MSMSVFAITPTKPVVVPVMLFDGQKWPMEFIAFEWRDTDSIFLARVNVFFRDKFRQEIFFPIDPAFPLVYAPGGELSNEKIVDIFREAQEAFGKARPDVEAW